MPRDLDIGLYRAFVSVAEEGSMTAAAHKLHLTQAAISQQIRRLENALGCQLFNRNRKATTVTPAGVTLLPKARAIILLSDEVRAGMSTPPILGEIKLGAPTDIVNSHLPMALRNFSREHPQVEITLVCRTSHDLIEDWRNNAIDLAIVEEVAGKGEQLAHAECLHVDQLVWIGARHGDAVNRTPLPVSLCNETNALRPAMVRALNECKINYRTVSELGTIETVSATVKTDLAISALLKSTVPDDIEILSGHSLLPELPHFEIMMLGGKNNPNPIVSSLCLAIREAFSATSRP